MNVTKKAKIRQARKRRIRKKVRGSEQQPRLCVRRSLSNIYAQLVDDSRSRALAQLTTLSKQVKERAADAKGKVARSRIVGNLIAEQALSLGIKKVVFDRGGHPYAGRVRAVAEGAREKGLQF